MSKIIAIAVGMIACSLQAISAPGPEPNQKVAIFHVTSVDRIDNSAACKDDSCSAVQYKVEGYVNTDSSSSAARYIISCDEYYTDKPFLHRNNICARFHTGSAYTAYLFSDSISFPYSGLNKSFETEYKIVSEKEIVPPPGQSDTNGSEKREANTNPNVREPAKGTEQLARETHN